jgi:gliding motility-associated transport system ATP-binding protein
MLVARGVAKSFDGRRALGGVTLRVDVGDAMLLVGRNGAGKTTLLRIATGFLDPDVGEVLIDGVPVTAAGTRAAAQAKLGYLPEHAPAPVELSVRDHLSLRARQKGLGKRAADAIDRVVAATAIGSELERRIGTLSKGYRQRVGLADALLGEPPLLVLDEPTSGMDPIQVAQMRDYLKTAAKDRAVIVSSHAVSDLEPLATRVAVLRAGELVACESVDEMRTRAGLRGRLEDAVVALLEPKDTAA